MSATSPAFPNIPGLPDCLNGKKAFIFDLDGTILDSMFYWLQRPSITVPEGRVFGEYYMKEKYNTVIRPKEHALAFLQFLHRKQIPFCIATHTPRSYTEDLMKRLEIDRLAAFYVDARELNTSKVRESRIYDVSTERIGFSKEEVVIFEDHLPSIRTAVGAGYCVVCVADENSAADAETNRALCAGYLDAYPDPELLKAY